MTRSSHVICLLILLTSSHVYGAGLAAKYPGDVGLAKDPDVLYFLDFDDKAATLAWSKGKTGYGWTGEVANVFAGGGALEIQQTKGTHDPYEIHPKITDSDVVYVRWYRKWEKGYDFTQHKMSGVYAKAPGASGAGEKPTGYDKYSCKLYVDFDGYPRFYTYHPDQQGIYGDGLHMNLAQPKIKVKDERWYCFEMMIKANTAPSKDGELKMWIDGVLVGHYKNMRFRDTNTLKINEFTYSAYVGGTWVSKKDQKLWDDQIVVARSYIGPLVHESSPDAALADRGPSGDIASSNIDGSARDRGTAADGTDVNQGPRGTDGCSVGASGACTATGVAFLMLLALLVRRRPA